MSNLHCSLSNAALCPLVLLPSLSLKNIYQYPHIYSIKNLFGLLLACFTNKYIHQGSVGVTRNLWMLPKHNYLLLLSKFILNNIALKDFTKLQHVQKSYSNNVTSVLFINLFVSLSQLQFCSETSSLAP